MDYVTTDTLNGDKWSYLDGWYYQDSIDGKPISKLSAKNFPNPHDIWESKMNRSEAVLQRPLTSDEKIILKPRQYIFAIWEHRNAYFDH